MVPNEDNRPVAYVTPLADIECTDDGYVIRAEMPGVGKGELEVTVDNSELIILGGRKLTNFSGEVGQNKRHK